MPKPSLTAGSATHPPVSAGAMKPPTYNGPMASEFRRFVIDNDGSVIDLTTHRH